MKRISNSLVSNQKAMYFGIYLAMSWGAVSLNVVANNSEYYFDDTLLLGSSSSLQTLDNLAFEQAFLPGRYQIDIYLNGKYLANEAVDFVALDKPVDQQQNLPAVAACFTPALVDLLNIKPAYRKKVIEKPCRPLNEYIQQANTVFNLASLRLDITIAQAYLIVRPHGYIDPASWDQGESMLFANYSTSSYYNSYNRASSHFIGLNLGANYKTWRFNQSRNYTYNSDFGWQGQIANSFITKAIEPIHSKLTIGDSYTNSSFFSGIGFRGIQLMSDDRMLPDNLIGYAPVVQGIAATNANIIVKQKEYVIYQTSVVPGPFIIDDLNPLSYGGDLLVEIHESDGEVSTFTIPFSIIPQAVRQGASRYNAVIGQIRDWDTDNNYFAELNYQYGISRDITFNSATRLSDGYYGLILGNSFNTRIGALSFNLSYSNTKQADHSHRNGWMGRVSYNKAINTSGTALVFNSYHYSRRNFEELNDYFRRRQTYQQTGNWQRNHDPQRSRFELSVNQSLNGFGYLYFSGSVQSYFSHRTSDKQLQLSYSNNWGGSSYGLTLNRAYLQSRGRYENIVSFNWMMPLFTSQSSIYLNNHVIRRADGGIGFQTAISGLTSEDKTTSLNFNLAKQDNNDDGLSWGAGVQKNFSVMTLNGNYSQNSANRQFSLNSRGSIVAHKGGLTLGQYLGDSFVLLEVPNASGTKVLNSPGVEVDRFGYALVPSVTPYRKNKIILDPSELDTNIELTENQKKIVPYAGIAAKVSFATIFGYPLVIRAYRADEQIIPLSAMVYDEDNIIVGMVGQRGQIYFRTLTLRGELWVRWGNDEDESCRLQYAISEPDPKQVLYSIDALCY